MKRIVTILTVVIFVLVAVAAFGTDQTAPAPSEKKAETKYMTVKGEVVGVDPVQKTITIKGKKKGDVVLSTTDKTKVLINNEKKSLEDVKVGDTASARYKVEGAKNIATKIKVTPKASTPGYK